jgi:hypothetical protein
MRASLSGATPAAMTTDGGAATDSNTCVVPPGCAFAFSGLFTAQSTTGLVKAWKIEGIVKCGATPDTVAFVGTPSVTAIAADAGAAAYSLALGLDTVNGAMTVTAALDTGLTGGVFGKINLAEIQIA